MHTNRHTTAKNATSNICVCVRVQSNKSKSKHNARKPAELTYIHVYIYLCVCATRALPAKQRIKIPKRKIAAAAKFQILKKEHVASMHNNSNNEHMPNGKCCVRNSLSCWFPRHEPYGRFFLGILLNSGFFVRPFAAKCPRRRHSIRLGKLSIHK